MKFKDVSRPCARCITLTTLCFSAQAQEGEEYEYFDYAEQPKNCSVSESITGGWVSYSLGGGAGSVLTYHCNEGSYPFPVSERECAEDGEWSTMRLANGRMVFQATCKGEGEIPVRSTQVVKFLLLLFNYSSVSQYSPWKTRDSRCFCSHPAPGSKTVDCLTGSLEEAKTWTACGSMRT